MTDKRTILIAILSGLLSGAMFSSPYFGIPFGMVLLLFNFLPLALVAFSKGSQAVIIAGIVSLVTIFGLTREITFVSEYIISYGLPAVGILALALWKKEDSFYPLGKIITWITAYALGCFLFLLGFMELTSDVSLYDQAQQQMQIIWSNIQNQNNTLATAPDGTEIIAMDYLKEAFEKTATYIPIMYMLPPLIILFLNIWIAQRYLRKHEKSLRPSFNFQHMRLPHWLAFLMVISSALAWFFINTPPIYFVFINVAMFLCFVVSIEGLAVIHDWAGKKNKEEEKKILTAIYIVTGLFLIPVIGLVFVALWNHVNRLRKAG